MSVPISQTTVNEAIRDALDAIAQYAAENGKTALQVIADSSAIDDETLKRALAFQAELNGPTAEDPIGELPKV